MPHTGSFPHKRAEPEQRVSSPKTGRRQLLLLSRPETSSSLRCPGFLGRAAKGSGRRSSNLGLRPAALRGKPPHRARPATRGRQREAAAPREGLAGRGAAAARPAPPRARREGAEDGSGPRPRSRSRGEAARGRAGSGARLGRRAAPFPPGRACSAAPRPGPARARSPTHRDPPPATPAPQPARPPRRPRGRGRRSPGLGVRPGRPWRAGGEGSARPRSSRRRRLPERRRRRRRRNRRTGGGGGAGSAHARPRPGARGARPCRRATRPRRPMAAPARYIRRRGGGGEVGERGCGGRADLGGGRGLCSGGWRRPSLAWPRLG